MMTQTNLCYQYLKKLSYAALFTCILWMHQASATEAQTYLQRFMAYKHWKEALPANPDPDFLNFIQGDLPLSQKLREKWLYQLARNRDWATYAQYYQPSPDLSLQCYEQLALYQQETHKQSAIEASKPLWRTGKNRPKACGELFDVLIKNNDIDNALIAERLSLALKHHNVRLSLYLLKQYHAPRLDEIKQLTNIHHNPRYILTLHPGQWHDAFYLYGLKRMVSKNMEQALQFWHQKQTKQLLSHAQQQAFLIHLVQYKDLRNAPDAPKWFAKIEPAFYNDKLLSNHIRFALKNKQWHTVEQLIPKLKDKENPCWQYWLARSLEAEGQYDAAKIQYEHLAKLRHYYGFLASMRLRQDFHFEEEPPNEDRHVLEPYQPILEELQTLYHSKHILAASRLTNDFISELPKENQSAFVYWLGHTLQWHGKAVYLSSTETLNNQLILRFPLAYRNTVRSHANTYHISEPLLYAIIRQESAFRHDVISPAGAYGLMQIMPNTARIVTKREKIPFSDKKQLFITEQNIRIGAAYLQQLSKRFGQHPILMTAAYNAGPRQVVFWLKNHPVNDIDIWIETLPWIETRNYLKNIMAFYAIYQYRLHQKPDLTPFMKPF